MKAISYYLSYLFIIVIPLVILYFKYDEFIITTAETMYIKLEEFLYNYRYGIEVEQTDWYLMGKYGFWGILSLNIMDKFISNRTSGLNLIERRADWMLSLWFIIKMSVIYYVIYLLSIYLQINTNSMMESINWLFYSVVAGVVLKLISTYMYFTKE
jgi:hypothetical protein